MEINPGQAPSGTHSRYMTPTALMHLPILHLTHDPPELLRNKHHYSVM